MSDTAPCRICGGEVPVRERAWAHHLCDRVCTDVSRSGLRVLRGNRKRGAGQMRIRHLLMVMDRLEDAPEGEWVFASTLSEMLDVGLTSVITAMRLMDPLWVETDYGRRDGRQAMRYRLLARPDSLRDLLGGERIDKARSVFL